MTSSCPTRPTRYFRSQPATTASIILLTGLHLIGGIPAWCDPFTLSFNGYRRLLMRSVSADLTLWVRTDDMSVSLISGSPIGDGLALAHDGSCCGS